MRKPKQWSLRTARIAIVLMLVATMVWILLSPSRLNLLWLPIEAVLIFWIWRHSSEALGNLRSQKQKRVTEKRMRRQGFGPYRD